MSQASTHLCDMCFVDSKNVRLVNTLLAPNRVVPSVDNRSCTFAYSLLFGTHRPTKFHYKQTRQKLSSAMTSPSTVYLKLNLPFLVFFSIQSLEMKLGSKQEDISIKCSFARCYAIKLKRYRFNSCCCCFCIIPIMYFLTNLGVSLFSMLDIELLPNIFSTVVTSVQCLMLRKQYGHVRTVVTFFNNGLQ